MNETTYRLSLDAAASGPATAPPGSDRPIPDPAVIHVEIDGAAHRVTLTMRRRHNPTPELTQLTVTTGEDSPALSASDLRAVKVAKLTRLALRYLALPEVKDARYPDAEWSIGGGKWEPDNRPKWQQPDVITGDPPPMALTASGMVLDPKWQGLVEASGPRGDFTTELVGNLHKYAELEGMKPTPVVQRVLGVSSATASNWIRYARDAGTVPPSDRKPRSDRKTNDA